MGSNVVVEREMVVVERDVYGEESMGLFGESLASILSSVGVVYLDGNLGMGKTTLVRGVLKGLGHIGPVKSPTYTLVEPYELTDLSVFHFDLYRVADPEELEYMGIRDYFQPKSLCMIEWAEMGQGVLPMADIEVHLVLLRQGRKVSLRSCTQIGADALRQLESRSAC